jgi:hypothetical protein
MSILGKKPVEIFDYSNLGKSYKDLLKKYHPDVGGSEDEFLFLQKNYELAKDELRLGYAVSSSSIEFFLPHYRVRFPFNSFADFHYGRVYVCDVYLIYEFSGNFISEDLKNTFTAFTYRDEKIKEKFIWRIPSRGVKIVDIYDTPGGENPYDTNRIRTLVKQFVIIDKCPPDYLLSDVMNLEIPLQTSVWILNRLYALGCYMSIIGTYCLDIAPHNITVNLNDHSLSLLGGWWYHAKEDGRILRLPASTYALMSNRMKETKTASVEIVTDQVKNLMRKMLKGRDIPAVYANWLLLPAQENIIDEYYQWEHEVMPRIFPSREFYKWEPKL